MAAATSTKTGCGEAIARSDTRVGGCWKGIEWLEVDCSDDESRAEVADVFPPSRLGKEQAPRGYVSAVLGRTPRPRPGRGRVITDTDKLISPVGWTRSTNV